MPPKGKKSKCAGSTENEGVGDNEIKTNPLSTESENENGENRNKTPPLEGDEDTDSEFNEGDSYIMLKKILLNQKLVGKKSDELYNKLSKTLSDSKTSLDMYKETNDKSVKKIQGEISNTAKDLKTLQEQVEGLQSEIKDANEKLDVPQKLLEDTRTNLNLKSEIVDLKLEKKYEKEEDELKRCLLLIDGVKEHGNKKPVAVVENLMKDLGIQVKESDIKTAYRLGPLETGVSRPRTIKVHFNKANTKGESFKNIGKLKDNKNWKGIHLKFMTLSPQLNSSK